MPIYRGKKGSKQFTGKTVVIPANSKKQYQWQSDCKMVARQAMTGDPMTGPVKIMLEFRFTRPKSHFGTGKNSEIRKPTAPVDHITKPDLDKLVRAVCDSLKGVIWRDDSQVIWIKAYKRYDILPGAEVSIQEL